jgi:O-methyltransferase
MDPLKAFPFKRFRRTEPAPAPPPESPDYGPFAPPSSESAYEGEDSYDDGTMKMGGRNVDFLTEPRFVEANQAGLNAGLQFTWPGTDNVIDMPWRVHIACWAARHAVHLPGDLVECGVHTGSLSLAICRYIDFNSTGKAFYLFDTFTGIPAEQMAEEEAPFRMEENHAYYREDSYETALKNFAQYPGVRLVRGRVPDTLGSVEIDAVSYLSLDMNIAAPEVAALEFFWPKLSVGAIVLLDDYGWTHYRPQKVALDKFAAKQDVEIATLPTGQGLLIKP